MPHEFKATHHDGEECHSPFNDSKEKRTLGTIIDESLISNGGSHAPVFTLRWLFYHYFLCVKRIDVLKVRLCFLVLIHEKN